MTDNYLHIISFNIPYPANYGGVIDVFYKLKALAENNIKIILHAFEYGRQHAPELEKYCEKVYYYKRHTGWKKQFSLLPYIVYTRKNEELLHNLNQDDYPILFEGLHTTYYLDHPLLKERMKLVRAHNIEHEYYGGLFRNERDLIKKTYFFLEAQRLKFYESKLHSADAILALSTTEKKYFEQHYGADKVKYIPLFAEMPASITMPETIREQVLYHGDLSTPENIRAARFLIECVAPEDLSIQWIIAGLNPHKSLIDMANKQTNVLLRSNLSQSEMSRLIEEAAVNMLYTNQISGVKLKLLNALSKGNHCLATKEMVNGSGLESLCQIITHNPKEIVLSVRNAFAQTITKEEKTKRFQLLSEIYNNSKNASKIIGLMM